MRILLVRTSALGDIVHTLPVLAALRQQLPDACVGWVVEATFAPLLKAHPDLNALFPVRTRAWRRQNALRTAGEIGHAIARLRAFRADLAFDLMGNHKGALLARLSGARRVIGPARQDRREPSSALWIHEPVSLSGDHAIDRALALLAPLGITPKRVDLGGTRLLPEARPDADLDLPYALIQPGAGWGNKQYPAPWWGQVAKRLRKATGLAIRVLIAPGEAALAEAVAAASGGAATPIDARAFEILVQRLRGACLVLGGDTGPLHLAHALGTRVLCVMGPTDPRRHGPYNASHSALWHRLPCSFCYKRMSSTRACLLAIAPERVVKRAISALDRAAGVCMNDPARTAQGRRGTMT